MRIGIIVAMDKEFEQLSKLFADDADVKVVKSGIGKVNAALHTQKLIDEFHPDAIISTGCAGACKLSINVGDVIISRWVTYHDVWCGKPNVMGQVQDMPAEYVCDDKLYIAALNLRWKNTGVNLREGLIASGDWFVTSKEKAEDIKRRVPEAFAIDMESAAIAQTCHINSVPFISFRVISDNVFKENNVEQYENFWDTMADKSFTIVAEYVKQIKQLKDFYNYD